ncbi:hypothetical protein GGX14DRAFT_701545, partial [Mycena pura]
MSKPTDPTSTVASTPALHLTPTLHTIPSFTTVPVPVPAVLAAPALAPIPNAAATSLARIMDDASLDESAVAKSLRPRPTLAPSFLEDDDLDLDLDDFFSPPSKGKGKAVAPPLAPPANDSTTAGPSNSTPAFLTSIGYTLHELPKKFGAPDHKTTRILVDTAAMGLVAVNDGHARLSTQFKELAEGVEARFIAFASEQREYVPGGTVLPSTFDTSIETALVSAVNKHTTNFGSMSQALNGGLARLAAAESSSNTIAAQITALTATVVSFENALQTVLARTSAPSSSLDVVNTNGKRARLDG